MKTTTYCIILLFALFSCNRSVIEKPENFIDQDKMEEIIYDLTVLEAMKSQNISTLSSYPSAFQFLKKKYKLDSITFVKNTKYYAADIENYKKIHQKVFDRIKKESEKLGAPKEILPVNEVGVVK